MMKILTVSTRHRNEIIDLTPMIRDWLAETDLREGLLCVYSPHTTAGISVNENFDPDVKRDLLDFLNRRVPQEAGFRHAEGNSDAHIKGALVNFSQMFIIEDGELRLGQWQGVYFMEFDGPRKRQIWLKLLAA